MTIDEKKRQVAKAEQNRRKQRQKQVCKTFELTRFAFFF